MITREQKVAILIIEYIGRKYDCKIELIELKGDTFLFAHNNKVNLLITVCETNKTRCIKIEEIFIEKLYRNKGICTDLINTIKEFSNTYNVKIGLWCEANNKKLFNYYSRLGFRYIETLKDDWLEYN